MGDEGVLHRSRAFAQTPASAAEARRWLREALEAATCQVDLDAVVLVTDELVANAAVHAHGSEIRVDLYVEGDGVRVAVSDDDPTPVTPRAPDPEGTGGRGFVIVDRLADLWGIRYAEGERKCVWFRLRAERKL